jgi:hypothetical protein
VVPGPSAVSGAGHPDQSYGVAERGTDDMTRLCRVFVGLGLLSLVLTGACWGQTRAGKGGGPGVAYNPQSVVTVVGIVVAKSQPAAKQGLPYLVYLTLKTEKGKITVFLGPSVYIDQLPVQIKQLDRIQVTGSQVIWAGKPVILAAEILKEDQVIKLRGPNGVPLWSGEGSK